MAIKPKSRQSAAARVVARQPSRPSTGPLSQVASGITHTPNPVHFMPGGVANNPNLNMGQPQPSDPYSAANLVNVLAGRGIQASTDPHPNDVGWGNYGNGLWVYAPQGPGSQGDPLGDARGLIASLTDPYLADSYKQQALQQLQGRAPDGIQAFPGGVQDNPNVNKSAILQAIQQQYLDRGQDVPASVTQQLGAGDTTTPAPTPAAPIPAPTPAAPIPTAPDTPAAPINAAGPTSSVVTAPSPVANDPSNPFGNSAPPPNLFANRSIPGFAAVNPRQHPTQPSHPMIGFGNLTNIAQRMLGNRKPVVRPR